MAAKRRTARQRSPPTKSASQAVAVALLTRVLDAARDVVAVAATGEAPSLLSLEEAVAEAEAAGVPSLGLAPTEPRPQVAHPPGCPPGCTGRDTQSGHILPHHNLNPGGRPSVLSDVRKYALSKTLPGLQMAWEWVRSGDRRLAGEGLRIILERALGKPGKAAELPPLPQESIQPVPEDVTAADVLEVSRRTIFATIARTKSLAEQGLVTTEHLSQVLELVRVLSAVEKESRELEKRGDEGRLPTELLIEEALRALPPEKLVAASLKVLGREKLVAMLESGVAGA